MPDHLQMRKWFALQMRLSNALQELAAGGGGPAAVRLAAALSGGGSGGGGSYQNGMQPPDSSRACGHETTLDAGAVASGGAGNGSAQAPVHDAGYEADEDVAGRQAARTSPPGQYPISLM